MPGCVLDPRDAAVSKANIVLGLMEITVHLERDRP